jgi:hypothetical protein
VCRTDFLGGEGAAPSPVATGSTDAPASITRLLVTAIARCDVVNRPGQSHPPAEDKRQAYGADDGGGGYRDGGAEEEVAAAFTAPPLGAHLSHPFPGTLLTDLGACHVLSFVSCLI